jgi:hypothetical protein
MARSGGGVGGGWPPFPQARYSRIVLKSLAVKTLVFIEHAFTRNEVTGEPLPPSNDTSESLHCNIMLGRESDVNDVENIAEANHTSDEQILASFKRLGEIQAKSIKLVTEKRVTADQREVHIRSGRDENGKRNENLYREHHSRYDEGVASGWEQCSAATNLQDLFGLLAKQKNLCESALAKLDCIGKELGSEMREKDDEYVNALRRNRQEIEELQQCVANEHLMLKAAFERELKLIEDSIMADKNFILNAHKDELEALVLKRKEEEAASMERQRKIIDEHKNGIKECESREERNREDLREKIGNEVRRLEIDLEDTRARNKFDSDKLEYNVRVLTELSENEGSVKKQRRRIMKVKEKLNHDLEDYHQARSKGIRQNDLLEADCERIEKQTSGLKEKFERLRISDDEKYRAVQSMHKDDLQKLQADLKKSQEFIFGGVIGCW